ncbi:MAG TPA: hypothetical protein VGX68_09085 [Thermoanaerobaculia bacterium]|jgi:predicted component of type VI protein secretion system|nr:hypothetical protein [Thermoanaerobaculia bacterium]
MSRETTLVTKLNDLGRLIAALAVNAAELPHLEGVRLHLQQLLTATLLAVQEHTGLTALIASRQDVRQRLLRLAGDTQRVATAVRKLLQAHYGVDSEKLAEFGIEPLRSRRAGPERSAPTIEPPADPPDTASSDV